MSHGPEEHIEHGEHAIHAAHNPFDRRVAMTIAIVAAVLACVTMLSHRAHNETILRQAESNRLQTEANILHTKASDQWNYYQSKSTKQALAEFARDTAPDDRRQAWQDKAVRYDKEKAEIQAAALKLEDEARDWDRLSDAQLHEHHRWAQATTALQVSIALAAMALLTRRKWLEWGMLGVAGGGLVVGVLAALHV